MLTTTTTTSLKSPPQRGGAPSSRNTFPPQSCCYKIILKWTKLISDDQQKVDKKQKEKTKKEKIFVCVTVLFSQICTPFSENINWFSLTKWQENLVAAAEKLQKGIYFRLLFWMLQHKISWDNFCTFSAKCSSHRSVTWRNSLKVYRLLSSSSLFLLNVFLRYKFHKMFNKTDMFRAEVRKCD